MLQVLGLRITVTLQQCEVNEMPTAKQYEELEALIGKVRHLERLKGHINAQNKVNLRNPITEENVLVDVPAGKIDSINADRGAAITALKAKFQELFP